MLGRYRKRKGIQVLLADEVGASRWLFGVPLAIAGIAAATIVSLTWPLEDGGNQCVELTLEVPGATADALCLITTGDEQANGACRVVSEGVVFAAVCTRIATKAVVPPLRVVIDGDEMAVSRVRRRRTTPAEP